MKTMLFLSVLFPVQTFAQASAGKVVGQLGLVDGVVLVDSKPVQKNAQVREGSIIEVKKNAHATVIMGKGSVFNIGEDSKVVVNQYNLKTDTQPENGELDLKFGKTRALIFNPGNEKKDIRIKARAATMGVRGTEIYVDSPKDPAKPLQFFTLEGKAEVRAFNGAVPVPVPQNQGVSTSGVGQPASSGSGSKDTAKSGTTATQASSAVVNSTAGQSKGDVVASSVSVAEVKAEIAKSGMDPAPAVPAALAAPAQSNNPSRAAPVGIADTTTMAPLPPPPLDPVLDRASALTLRPRFCNATTGVCN